MTLNFSEMKQSFPPTLDIPGTELWNLEQEGAVFSFDVIIFEVRKRNEKKLVKSLWSYGAPRQSFMPALNVNGAI